MKQALINRFGSIIKGEIECALHEHIVLAYNAMMAGSSNKKILYLLGGNNPSKCPF